MSLSRESSFPLPERTGQAAALGVLVLTLSWALLHVGFWDRQQIVDTPVYQNYGEAVLDGQVPYRDFGLEYPPAALPAFVLPALAADDDYAPAFELLMWLCGAAAIVFLAYTLTEIGAGPARLYAAVMFLGLAPLALGSVVLSRYDLWPAALTIAALAAFVSGRDRLGFGVVGLATAAKIYPVVLLPLALVWVGRRRGSREVWIGLACFAAVLAACVVPFAILAPDGVVDSLQRQLARPLQIESLGAAVLLAAHRLGAYDPAVVSSSGSQNLDGALPDALAAIQTALQAAALVAVWALFALRARGREALLVASAAAVTAFVAFGKVLSPQFLIWLLPLVPAVAGGAGLAGGAVLAAALVTTQLWFPYRYWDVVALAPASWLVLVRDLLLVALFAILLVALSRRRSEEPHSA
ncbi:MAG: glycosyltransferase 87 family protein [Gaiellaceae bacterium]